VEVTEFENPDDNCVCPLKLLLVHALRTGAVAEKSWDELKRVTKSRWSKKVVWAHPKRPVICAIDAEDGTLHLDQPSPVSAAADFLEDAGQKAGALARLSPHDIRRGGALEAKLLLKHRAVGLEAARKLLGQTRKAMLAGATMKWVGHFRDDGWRTRLAGQVPETAQIPGLKFEKDGHIGTGTEVDDVAEILHGHPQAFVRYFLAA
jgi:hypothetical protein